jgi:hypothetical protein
MKNFHKYLSIIQEKTIYVPGSGDIPEDNITTLKELNNFIYNQVEGSSIERPDPSDPDFYFISLGETDEILIPIRYPKTLKDLIKEVLYHKSLNFLLQYVEIKEVNSDLDAYVYRMNGSRIKKNERNDEYQVYIPQTHGSNKAQIFSIKYNKDILSLFKEIEESKSLNFLLRYRINKEPIQVLSDYIYNVNRSTIEQTDPNYPNIYIVDPSETNGTRNDMFSINYDKGINELIREVVTKGSLKFLLKYKVNDKNESSKEQNEFDKIELNTKEKSDVSNALKRLILKFDSNFIEKIDINIDKNPIIVHITTDVRGPGIDTGGGEDGEEWMDEEELEKEKELYFNVFRKGRYSLNFKKFKEKFNATEDYSEFKNNSKINCYIDFDYEEDGTVCIILYIKPESLKNSTGIL